MADLELDALDRGILAALSQDCRRPVAEIARRLGRSKQVVAYRLDRMQTAGLFKYFGASVEWRKLGLSSFRLYLQLENAGPREYAAMVSRLKSIDSAFFVGTAEGSTDLMARFVVADVYAFQEAVDKFTKEFGRFIGGKEVTVVTYDPLGFAKPPESITGPLEARPARHKTTSRETDAVDLRIIKSVIFDCRKSTAAIAADAGVSQETAALRLRQLVAGGVITGFKPVLDASKLGLEHKMVFLRLKSASPDEKHRLFDYYSNHPNVSMFLGCVGNWDAEIDFNTTNSREFHDLVMEMKREFGPVIRNYETATVLDVFYKNPLP